MAADGGIFSFGDATFHGSAGGAHLNRPIVGMGATNDGGGYYLAASDGGIFTYGDAAFAGSAGGAPLNAPVVGMAVVPSLEPFATAMTRTPDGHGYWVAGDDGEVLAFGDAAFYGSLAAANLRVPIVGIAATPNGHGYWLVDALGHVTPFGDAADTGSLTGPWRRPSSASPPTPTAGSGWLVPTAASTPSEAPRMTARRAGPTSTGPSWAWGPTQARGATGWWLTMAASSPLGSPFFGSPANQVIDSPMAGLSTTADGDGYWMTTEDGTVYAFGNATGGDVQPHDLGGLPASGIVGTASGHGYWLVDLGGFVHASGDAELYPLNP